MAPAKRLLRGGRIQHGPHEHGARATKRLIEAHVDVAHNIARGLARRYGWILDADDITGTAMIGLCEAATRFDATRAEPFIAFAAHRIRGAIVDEVRRLGAHGRITNQRRRRISEARRRIAQVGGEASDEEVAALLGLSVATIRRTGEAAVRVLEDHVASLPSPDASPEAQLACAQFVMFLERAREALSALEALVVGLHYDGGVPLAEIARASELTLGRVRHAHATALARMRDTLRERVSDREGRSELVPDALGDLAAAR